MSLKESTDPLSSKIIHIVKPTSYDNAVRCQGGTYFENWTDDGDLKKLLDTGVTGR